jgi:hypothetical protein
MHYGSAYVQLKGIQILTICLISKGRLFFIHPVYGIALMKKLKILNHIFFKKTAKPIT